MTVPHEIEAGLPDMIAWRRAFHRQPELAYEEHRTAATVTDLLRSFGVDEIATGIGGTGVVAIVRGGDGPRVALRADMDALPIAETGSPPWRSEVPGKMHACGHDGHMTMLLGAARYLAADATLRRHRGADLPAGRRGSGRGQGDDRRRR